MLVGGRVNDNSVGGLDLGTPVLVEGDGRPLLNHHTTNPNHQLEGN